VLDLLVADQRLAAGVPGTLSFANVNADGDPLDATGAVTVRVQRADGTDLIAAGAATTHGDTGLYSLALTPAQTAGLGLLTITWTEAGAGSFTTTAEVVGRHYLTTGEIRRLQPDLADPDAYPAAALAWARLVAELECEHICGRSFVPRARRVILDGTEDVGLFLPDQDITGVTAVDVDGTAYTADQLDELAVVGNLVEHTRSIWPAGRGAVVIDYRFGLVAPPADLKHAMSIRVREIANQAHDGIPARAENFNPEGGATVALANASQLATGNPDVDAVYQRYSLRPTGGSSGGNGDGGVGSGAAGVSRSLDMNPQYGSLFHGGRM
jgi:hypothetical protein